MRKHSYWIYGQIELAPIENEVLKHAAGKVSMRLRLMLQVDQKAGILTTEPCLYEQIAGSPLAIKRESFFVDKLKVIEVDERGNIRQKSFEKIA